MKTKARSKPDAFSLLGGKAAAPVEERLQQLRALDGGLLPAERWALLDVYTHWLIWGKMRLAHVVDQPWRALVEKRLLENAAGMGFFDLPEATKFDRDVADDVGRNLERGVDWVKPTRRGELLAIAHMHRRLLEGGAPQVKRMILETVGALLAADLEAHGANKVAQDIREALRHA